MWFSPDPLPPPPVGMSRHSLSHTTYINFSASGDRLVATYHGDHTYTFDLTSALSGTPTPSATLIRPSGWCSAAGAGGVGASSSASAPPAGTGSPGRVSEPAPSDSKSPYSSSPSSASRTRRPSTSPPWGLLPACHSPQRPWGTYPTTAEPSGSGTSGSGSGSIRDLPEEAEEARRRANRLILDEDWPAAIGALSLAVRLAPWCAQLYARRSEALLGRVSLRDMNADMNLAGRMIRDV